MKTYEITFRGGGPKVASNRKGTISVQASTASAAVGKVLRRAADDGWNLPLQAWTHLTVKRIC